MSQDVSLIVDFLFGILKSYSSLVTSYFILFLAVIGNLLLARIVSLLRRLL